MPASQRPSPEEQETLIAQQEEFAKSWFRFYLNYNPADDWERIDAPILVIFAELDVQVTVAQNLEPFTEALENGVSSDHEIVILEDTNHLFQPDAQTGALMEYMSLETRFTSELIPLIRDWLLSRVTVA